MNVQTVPEPHNQYTGNEAPRTNHQHAWRSHRNVLIILATAMILMVAVSFAWELNRERELLVEQTRATAVTLASSLAANTKSTIAAADAILGQVAYEVSNQGFTAAGRKLDEQNKQITSLLPALGNIFLINKEGVITQSTIEGVTAPVSVAAIRSFLDAKQTGSGELYFVEPMRGLVTSDTVMPLAKRLEGPDGAFAGFAVATIGPNHFDELFAGLSLRERSAILLAHVDGMVLTRYPKSPAIGTSFSKRPLFSEHLKRASSGTYLSPLQSDGEIRMVAFEKVPGAPFVVAAAIHLGDALAPWREHLYLRSSFLLAFAALALANAAYLSRRAKEQELLLFESKIQAAKLKKSAARYRDLTRLSMDWYWETDLDQRFTSISDSQSLRSIGLTPAMLEGVKRSELADSLHAEGVVKKIQIYMEKHLEFHDLCRPFNLKNGKTLWISISGKPMYDETGNIVGYRGSARDVSAKLLAERKIREQRELLRMVIENVPSSIYLKDLAGNYLLINERQCAFLGFPREQLEGKRLTDLCGEAWAHDYEAQDAEVIRKREVVEFDLTVHKDDVAHHYHVTKFPVFDVEGEFVALGGINEDVTERVRFKTRLKEAEKVSAIGKLTGGIAHDFNNILAVVIGNLEMALSETDEAKQQTLMKDSLNAAERSAELTSKLLAFGRRAPLDARRIYPGLVLKEIEDLLRVTIPERIRLRLEVEEDIRPIVVDEAQYISAILNLAINSRDAIPASGEITITLRNREMDARSLFAMKDSFVQGAGLDGGQGDYVSIAVADSGPGISESAMNKVFDPFFTTKEVGKGSGLGLSMVHGFTVQSRGGISLETAEGEGTTISLYFPVAQDSLQACQPFEGHAERLSDFTGLSVLLVEDEPMVRNMARRNLEDLGFEVHVATTGDEAVAFLESDTPLDLLMTDGVLPGDAQGPAVAASAKERRPDIKTLLVSGYPTEEIERAGGVLAFDQILMKPYRKKALRDAISKAINH